MDEHDEMSEERYLRVATHEYPAALLLTLVVYPAVETVAASPSARVFAIQLHSARMRTAHGQLVRFRLANKAPF